ncbi:P-loop containing nucleoside triphosphate hydrolase [Ostreococcus tauri]|uniref:P-loop containing nucleoside triphosphate hydrolase n=1 Tax=Ostreococcus tauri TaxID=70448 RepID=A0A096P7V4_OSTTA|nr:P-loop containing nucleoside triphosphate hydrolase [Ostreococcus tauri]CEG00306.1 P-loop containing nucleoside triphosphate hydrolase [Ostreococcus tauri]|eukprot:XP_022840307.1 P-loop containing nucleoside triphosphate hydrolase [Ostreococcus tauri]
MAASRARASSSATAAGSENRARAGRTTTRPRGRSHVSAARRGAVTRARGDGRPGRGDGVDVDGVRDAEASNAVVELARGVMNGIGRALRARDETIPGAVTARVVDPRPTVAPSPVPRWAAPFVDQYFVDHKAQARALRAGREWDARAEEAQFQAVERAFRSGKNEKLNEIAMDYPDIRKKLARYRRARKVNRKEMEDTYPDASERVYVRFGLQRWTEKLGIWPRVDGEATYAQFLEFLEKRQVSRVLLYENGHTAIVEIGGPGAHLDPGSIDVIRWKVEIPGDAHEEVTLACKKAFYAKPANPNDMFTTPESSCQVFMNISPWNYAIHGARNWIMAGTFFWFIGWVISSAYAADRSADVLRKRAKTQRQANERDALASEMGKSKAKLVKKNQSNVRFSDVAGQDMVVSEFQTIIDIMKGNPKYKGRFVEAPKGILLEGPPGTGKTLLAKAVAGEAGLPFFYANGSEFVEMFVGVAASRMRNLFKRARTNAPAIIFIDELDTIGRSRASNAFRDDSTSEREQGLMQMLVEMDGFDNKESGEAVLVIGATNLASQLDPALLRSGRFDRVFHIGVPPTAEARMPILQVHARKLNINRAGDEKYETDAFLHRVADLTTGFSGAELANLLNEAAILSVRNDKDVIDIADIEAILEKQAVGLISAPLEGGWGKEHLAIIEAAKAVIFSARPDICPEVLQVSIRPRGSQISGIIVNDRSPEAEAEIHANDGPDTLNYYIESLAVMLIARCAELHFFGADGVTIRTNEDVAAAAEMAFEIVSLSGLYPDKKVLPIMDPVMLHEFRIPREGMEDGTRDVMMRAHTRGIELVKEYAPLIQSIASELLSKDRMYGSQVRSAVSKFEETLGDAKSRTPSYVDEIAMSPSVDTA